MGTSHTMTGRWSTGAVVFSGASRGSPRPWSSQPCRRYPTPPGYGNPTGGGKVGSTNERTAASAEA